MSSLEDRVAAMTMRNHLLHEIEAFLSDTGMGPSYFGKQAVGNSEIVPRLRAGRRVWPETESRIRAFILAERRRRPASEAAA